MSALTLTPFNMLDHQRLVKDINTALSSSVDNFAVLSDSALASEVNAVKTFAPTPFDKLDWPTYCAKLATAVNA